MAQAEVFSSWQLEIVGEAVGVAEESVSEFFAFSEGFWLKHPYQLRTGAQLLPSELTPRALAQVLKVTAPARRGELRPRQLYRICVQDHNVLRLLRTEAPQLLLPLMIYVLVHELVHVVRFYTFQHLFEAGPRARAREEKIVHAITQEILSGLKLPWLEKVLRLYKAAGAGVEAW